MDRCENCGQEQRSVMLRPNGKRLCADCNQERLIAMDPTNLVVWRLARFNGKRRIRCWYLNAKWIVVWAIIYAFGLEEWADKRWYAKFDKNPKI